MQWALTFVWYYTCMSIIAFICLSFRPLIFSFLDKITFIGGKFLKLDPNYFFCFWLKCIGGGREVWGVTASPILESGEWHFCSSSYLLSGGVIWLFLIKCLFAQSTIRKLVAIIFVCSGNSQLGIPARWETYDIYPTPSYHTK